MFDARMRNAVFGALTYQSAQDFRQNLKQKMLSSQPTGRVESVGEGKGFNTRFRRSARGQRPAIQTRRLLNSIFAYKNGEKSARTEVTARTDKGVKYGEILQAFLDRQIMSREDVEDARKSFVRRGNEAVRELL